MLYFSKFKGTRLPSMNCILCQNFHVRTECNISNKSQISRVMGPKHNNELAQCGTVQLHGSRVSRSQEFLFVQHLNTFYSNRMNGKQNYFRRKVNFSSLTPVPRPRWQSKCIEFYISTY